MPRYTEKEARAAVASSRCYAEALRRLGLQSIGGNHRTFRKWVDQVWKISTDHFDPLGAHKPPPVKRIPLEEILVEGSTFSRGHLKARLLGEGLKTSICELCGQGEMWRGKRMSLILDHVNGVRNDHRLENLRIVCPNCAATLNTHCGRKNRITPTERECRHCGKTFTVKYPKHRYCSRECGTRHRHQPQVQADWAIGRRKVQRPPFWALLMDIDELGYCGTGRKYGVSDNAIRKWVAAYDRELELGDVSAA